MNVKLKLAAPVLLCAFALALASCTYSRPPQTGFYCVDIPQGRAAEASRFVHAIADRLDFKVSEAHFPSENGPPSDVWEVYGGGVSLFVGTALRDGKSDRFGNRPHAFNPSRLDLNVSKTWLWQTVSFNEVLAVAKSIALQKGWSFTQAATGESCAT